MDAAIAGLIGVAIGAGASLLTVWIQASYQAKRERARFVMEFAASDRKTTVEDAIRNKMAGPVAPVALYAFYHANLLRLIESDQVNEAALQKLSNDTDTMWREIRRIDLARRNAPDL